MAAIVMGKLVSELPEPFVPSVKKVCASCKQEVWLDERTAEETEGMIVMCMRCVDTLGWHLKDDVAS